MPKLKDIISDKSKKNIMKIKDSGNIAVSDFIGQTPNLNSSLGVNAFAGVKENFAGVKENFGEDIDLNDTGALAASNTDQSKASTFWNKNSDWITGLGGSIFGAITGGGTSATQPNGNAPLPPEEDKKGMPAWAWALIIIALVIVIVLIVRAMRKGK